MHQRRCYRLFTAAFMLLCTQLVNASPNANPAAEKLYAEKQYKAALATYQAINPKTLDDEARQWHNFRIAELNARIALRPPKNREAYANAIAALNAQLREHQKARQPNLKLLAHTHNILGELAMANHYRSTYVTDPAMQHFRAALNTWGKSTDITSAKPAFLNILRHIHALTNNRSYSIQNSDISTLQKAIKLAEKPTDKALFAYQLAELHKTQRQYALAHQAFKHAITHGKNTAFYDRITYKYANFLENWGRRHHNDAGVEQFSADYAQAKRYYQQILDEHGEKSHHHNNAKNQLANIIRKTVRITLPGAFHSNDTPQFQLTWRNLNEIDVAIYRVDLAQRPPNEHNDWLTALPLGYFSRVWKKTFTKTATQAHYPLNETVALDETLTPGAYVIYSDDGHQDTRALLLVTDIGMAISAAHNGNGENITAYLANTQTGQPQTGAPVTLWQRDRYWQGRKYHYSSWQKSSAKTDNGGLVTLPLDTKNGKSRQYLISTSIDDDHGGAAILSSERGYANTTQKHWKLYAYTDRPLYRPGDTVHWKTLVRHGDGFAAYEIPANRQINYRIIGPQGTALREETLELNDVGTINGKFTLPDNAGLGAVRIEFRQQSKHIGSAELFRIEEFKRPEYQVKIAPTTAKQYQLGDSIPLTIDASYYFGGAVANADVEIIVRRSDYHHLWKWAADDAWLNQPHNRGYGRHGYTPRTEVLRQKIRTDAAGKAEIVLDTDATLRDQTYHLEARVVDASRREVVAKLDLSVTQAPYFAYLRSAQTIVSANQAFDLDIKLLNAQNQNVAGAGKLIIERAEWHTFWQDKNGQRFEQNNDCGCLLEQRETQWQDITTTELAIPKTTDDNTFKHPLKLTKNGFYRLRWQGQNAARGNQPLAQTNLWVMDGNTRKIDQPNGALTLLTHPAEPQPGDTLQIYLISQNPTHIWLNHAHNQMDAHQTLRISDNVAYAELPITAQMQPNFTLTASAFFEDNFLQTSQNIIVKPQQQFLDVQVSANQAHYQPREQGQIRIHTKDHRGEPVSAEVSLTVVDESLYYIQPDISSDIRQFFYGQQRHFYAQRMNSTQQNRFAPQRPLKQRFTGINLGYTDGAIAISNEADGLTDTKSGFVVQPSVAPNNDRRESGQTRSRLATRKNAPRDHVSNTQTTPETQIIVRHDFRATALWLPTITTNKNGEASVPVTWPDTLTRWKTLAKAIDDHSRVGSGESQAVTRQPFIARLQKPRFLTVGDTATVTAVFNNNLDEALTVTPTLSVDNAELTEVNKRITLPANSGQSVEWQLRSTQTGPVKLELTARAQTAAGKTFTDASRHTLTAYEYGITKSLLQSGRLAADASSINFALNLPRQRKANTSQLNIQLTPSIAVTMLDALPYLIDYPYGCTEQTLSRFVPTMIVGKTLADLGLDKQQIAARSFGGISSNYAPKLGERSLTKLTDMRDAGLKKLLAQQNNDGGWGWWPTGDSDHYMSAYVVWGLSLAQQHNIDLGSKQQRHQLTTALQRGRDYLAKHLAKKLLTIDNPELATWMLHAATNTPHLRQKDQLIKSVNQLWKARHRLSSYGQALLALSLHRLQDQRAKKLLAVLVDHAIIDDKPDQSLIVNTTHSTATPTAYWGKADNYLRWQDGAVETTSWALMALMAITPDHQLIVPAMNWLVKNRRGAQWNNTRDTAMTVLALNQYLQNSQELASNSEFVLRVNGQDIARKTVNAQDLLIAPSSFDIDPALLKTGYNRVEIKRISGTAPLYFLAHAQFFTQEDTIPATGHEIFVERFYERLDNKPTLLNGNTTVKNRLKTGDKVHSGERFEVVLLIEAKNDYEYLMFEDFKPAGLEAVQLTSGMNARARQINATQAQRIRTGERVQNNGYSGGSQPVYQEMRDRKIANFITKLPQGFWEIRYTVRAETPGLFAALPTRAEAMYVPEVKGNSSSRRWEILSAE